MNLNLQRDAYRHTAWGVRPETLVAIAAVLKSGIRAEDMDEQRLEQQAAFRATTSTTGGVAVLPLKGLITPQPSFLSLLFGGGGGLQGFRAQLREAVASDDITAIVMNVDSPGGSTDLIAETAAEIRAAREVKPVIAVANTWAASAAYWLAAQADELVVTPSGEVGSIGVFTLHDDISGMQDQLGIKTTVISAGRYKAEGNPYEPLSAEAEAAIQAKVDEFYGLFVADVAKGRGVSPSAVANGYGEGRMLTAKAASAEGMADRVDTLEATVARVVRNPRRARRQAATTDRPEGTPDPNLLAPASSEEEKARPSEPYIDLMFGATR